MQFQKLLNSAFHREAKISVMHGVPFTGFWTSLNAKTSAELLLRLSSSPRTTFRLQFSSFIHLIKLQLFRPFSRRFNAKSCRWFNNDVDLRRENARHLSASNSWIMQRSDRRSSQTRLTKPRKKFQQTGIGKLRVAKLRGLSDSETTGGNTGYFRSVTHRSACFCFTRSRRDANSLDNVSLWHHRMDVCSVLKGSLGNERNESTAEGNGGGSTYTFDYARSKQMSRVSCPPRSFGK